MRKQYYKLTTLLYTVAVKKEAKVVYAAASSGRLVTHESLNRSYIIQIQRVKTYTSDLSTGKDDKM